eukprot:Nk52_evm1s1629 gene=Nk52_evmTU1s1629
MSRDVLFWEADCIGNNGENTIVNDFAKHGEATSQCQTSLMLVGKADYACVLVVFFLLCCVYFSVVVILMVLLINSRDKELVNDERKNYVLFLPLSSDSDRDYYTFDKLGCMQTGPLRVENSLCGNEFDDDTSDGDHRDEETRGGSCVGEGQHDRECSSESKYIAFY